MTPVSVLVFTRLSHLGLCVVSLLLVRTLTLNPRIQDDFISTPLANYISKDHIYKATFWGSGWIWIGTGKGTLFSPLYSFIWSKQGRRKYKGKQMLPWPSRDSASHFFIDLSQEVALHHSNSLFPCCYALTAQEETASFHVAQTLCLFIASHHLFPWVCFWDVQHTHRCFKLSFDLCPFQDD